MDSYEIIKDGSPKAVIVIGDESTEIEALAAKRVSGYFLSLTDVALPVRKCSEAKTDSPENLILIGTPESNALLSEVLRSRSPLKAGGLGSEGYFIKTVSDKYLLIAAEEGIETKPA